MNISLLTSQLEKCIDQTVTEIKSKSCTYAEAIRAARRIRWPDRRPSRIESKILNIIATEVEERLEEEFRSIPLQK